MIDKFQETTSVTFHTDCVEIVLNNLHLHVCCKFVNNHEILLIYINRIYRIE